MQKVVFASWLHTCTIWPTPVLLRCCCSLHPFLPGQFHFSNCKRCVMGKLFLSMQHSTWVATSLTRHAYDSWPRGLRRHFNVKLFHGSSPVKHQETDQTVCVEAMVSETEAPQSCGSKRKKQRQPSDHQACPWDPCVVYLPTFTIQNKQI